MKQEIAYKFRKIKSPLNYIGGKAKILDQILPLFPKEIDNFIETQVSKCLNLIIILSKYA